MSWTYDEWRLSSAQRDERDYDRKIDEVDKVFKALDIPSLSHNKIQHQLSLELALLRSEYVARQIFIKTRIGQILNL